KKRHTVKVQLVICVLTLAILSLVVGKGQQHDFSVFKDSRLLLSRCPAVGGFGIPRDAQTPSEIDPAGQKEKRPTPFG
ncbi:MAG: hypothetical protein WC856_29055, partial [Methylococcaceae bacterium]